MKKFWTVIMICAYSGHFININSQGFNEDKTALGNFIKRMYINSPFDGVKIIEDYDNKYFISVVSLEKAKYNSIAILNRVAQVKARQQANTFFNGSNISSDIIIKTSEKKDSTGSKSTVEMMESIKENSIGFVEGLELLINFDINQEKYMVFIYSRKFIE